MNGMNGFFAELHMRTAIFGLCGISLSKNSIIVPFVCL